MQAPEFGGKVKNDKMKKMPTGLIGSTGLE